MSTEAIAVPAGVRTSDSTPAKRPFLSWLPRGWELSDETWWHRHRGILVVLWLHVVGIPIFGIVRGISTEHLILEAGAVGVFAIGATLPQLLSRQLRTAAATAGLLSSSAVLVHLSGGTIEMHFHFFVMVPVVALYQDWVPFLLAIGYVLIHHGLVGMLDPESVFNHPAAINGPWKWAGIHALFIAGISAVCLVTWRLLEHALREARAEAHAKTEFLSVMSHEIRTPLTAVLGYTGLLLDTKLTPEQDDYLRTVQKSGDHLLSVINDILDFSRIESGQIDLEEGTFDPLNLVEEAVGLVYANARARGINIVTLCEPALPRSVIGDSGRVLQVLLNLISNAVKFTEKGEVIVRAGAARRSEDAYELRFDVQDTGIGIDDDVVAHLFDAFTQAEASTSRRYGGSGLGLAIAKKLCERMGGSIDVESEPGVGSTFTATMIVREAPIEIERVGADLSALSVLIASRADSSTRALQQYMEQWGTNWRSTEDPAQALEWLHGGEAFDIAFIDDALAMPDPRSVASQIRDASRRPIQLALVADTAWEPNGDTGFDVVLTRPLRPSRIYNVLMAIETAAGPARTSSALPDPHMGARLPLRILVAEDNHVSQKVLLAQLRRLGYEADVAANGSEAVEAVLRRPYDVILMDLDMPEMDGLTATRLIRKQLSSGDRVNIVVLTAQSMPGGSPPEVDHFLTKPVTVPELAGVLAKCGTATGEAAAGA